MIGTPCVAYVELSLGEDKNIRPKELASLLWCIGWRSMLSDLLSLAPSKFRFLACLFVVLPLLTDTLNLLRPRKIPLSSFIVEDMNEFVQAHATYRFVIVDEEEDRPRILVRRTQTLSHFVQNTYDFMSFVGLVVQAEYSDSVYDPFTVFATEEWFHPCGEGLVQSSYSVY